MSHIAVTSGDTVKRFWQRQYLTTTQQDTYLPRIGDVIQDGTIFLTIIDIQYDTENYPVWLGTLVGAQERYGLPPATIIAWGRRGVALSYPCYMQGVYYTFHKGKSYLWT